ncbi:MAG: hypothetical protein AAB263_11880, partial [Planctomycetota bacterium]
RINNNIAGLIGRNSLARNDMAVSRSLEKLSTGLRINRAADDAAGLIISEQMRAQIHGLTAAISNAEKGVSMVQSAEAAMDQINSLLLKARDLAIDANNVGANDQNTLIADQTELDNIIASIDRIASTTKFGTKTLLDGSLANAKVNDARLATVTLGGQYNENLLIGNVNKGYHTLVITAQATKTVSSFTLSGADIIASGATNVNFSLSGMGGTEQFQKGFVLEIFNTTVTVASGLTRDQFLNQLNGLGGAAGFNVAISPGNIANGTTGVVAIGQGQFAFIATNYGSNQIVDIQFKSGASGAASAAGVNTTGADARASLILNTGAQGATALTGGTAITLSGGFGLNILGSATGIAAGFGVTPVTS